MNKIRRNIPNAITCGNLFCGCLSLVKAFEGDLVWAAYLVGIAVVLDFFDGFTARLLKVSSPIGKDLDSLADMVTFGVVPGVVMFLFIKNAISAMGDNYSAMGTYPEYFDLFPYLAFLIPVFSAIRLAKFNHDPRQTNSFIGLPTPANALFFCSFPLVLKQVTEKYAAKNPLEMLVDVSSDPTLALFNTYWFLMALTILFSFLLLAEFHLFSLKFKSFSWKENKIQFVFLALALALLIIFKFAGIPLIIVLYILLSLITNQFTRRVSN